MRRFSRTRSDLRAGCRRSRHRRARGACRAQHARGGLIATLIPEDETRSSHAPMRTRAGARSLVHMKKRLLFVLFVTGLLVLALGGWTVQGLRWATTGGWARGVPQTV